MIFIKIVKDLKLADDVFAVIYFLENVMLDKTFLEDSEIKNFEKADSEFQKAGEFHQKYLIKQQNCYLEEAITHYLKTMTYNPQKAEAYYRLATLMWEKGDITLDMAIEQCNKAVKLAPKNINSHIYSGYFKKIAEDFAGAEAEFKTAIKLNPFKSARARFLLALSILRRVNLNKYTKIDVLNLVKHFSLGSLMLIFDLNSLRMFYTNFKEDLSILAYKTVGSVLESLNIFNSALKIYEKATKKTGHIEVFYNKIGDLFVKNQDFDTAIECYKKSYQANPNNRSLLLKLAGTMFMYQPENIDTVIDYYNKLLEFNLDMAKLYYELGHLYLKKEDKINSISAFKLALREEEENPYYNNSLGFAYLRAELYEDAIMHYQKAIALNPDAEWTSLVCHTLGSIYMEILADIDVAISTYQTGLILNPKNYDLHLALGDVYMACGDLDNAIRTYCEAIKVDENKYSAYSKVALALWEKGLVEESVISYHKAIELNPDFDIAQNNLGVVYLDGFKDAQKSVEYFKRAIEINPSYTLAYFNLARAYEELHEENDAADYYQMALDLNKLTEEMKEEDILEKLYGLFNL